MILGDLDVRRGDGSLNQHTLHLFSCDVACMHDTSGAVTALPGEIERAPLVATTEPSSEIHELVDPARAITNDHLDDVSMR